MEAAEVEGEPPRILQTMCQEGFIGLGRPGSPFSGHQRRAQGFFKRRGFLVIYKARLAG